MNGPTGPFVADDCRHEDFVSEVEIHRLTPDEGGDEIVTFVAELQIRCNDCDAAFGFRGPPAGFSFREPRCRVDATQISLPLMSPAELQLAGPLPVLERGPMVYEARP